MSKIGSFFGEDLDKIRECSARMLNAKVLDETAAPVAQLRKVPAYDQAIVDNLIAKELRFGGSCEIVASNAPQFLSANVTEQNKSFLNELFAFNTPTKPNAPTKQGNARG